MIRVNSVLLVSCAVLFWQPSLSGQGVSTDSPKSGPVVNLQFFDGLGCEPGAISVWFRSDVTPQVKKHFVKAFGLQLTDIEHAYAGSGIVQKFGTDVLTSDGFVVPVGTEEFWVRLLKQHPLVREASFVPYQTASVDYYVSRDLNKHLPFVSASGDSFSSGSLRDLLLASLRQKYTTKKAEVRVLESDENRIKIQVRNLQSEVIAQSRYWEQIDQLVVVFFVVGNNLKMDLLLDGSYAATLGDHPPADDAFSSFEPKYLKEVQNYLQELTTNLLNTLRNKEVTND